MSSHKAIDVEMIKLKKMQEDFLSKRQAEYTNAMLDYLFFNDESKKSKKDISFYKEKSDAYADKVSVWNEDRLRHREYGITDRDFFDFEAQNNDYNDYFVENI